MKKYKKLNDIVREEIKNNENFKTETIKQRRIFFRYRSSMYEAKINVTYKPAYKADNCMCDGCEMAQDENTHVVYCNAYKHLREGNRDLEVYLQKVLIIC